MNHEELLVERDGHVLTLAINRPDQRNALNGPLMDAIRDQIERANSDKDLRAIVLTAVGAKAFCAGADLASGASFKFNYAEPRMAFAELFRAQDPNSFQPKIGFQTRYGVVANPFSNADGTSTGVIASRANQYYRIVNVRNLM